MQPEFVVVTGVPNFLDGHRWRAQGNVNAQPKPLGTLFLAQQQDVVEQEEIPYLLLSFLVVPNTQFSFSYEEPRCTD